MKELDGLFAYLGSKRKMAKYIISLLKGNTFVDGFMGSGVVSLSAKLHNFEVIANDNSLISSLIGYGILENHNLWLKKEDIAFLYKPAKTQNLYCETNYQTIAPISTLQFIDNALENVYQLKNCQYKSLMLYTIVNLFLKSKPYSNAYTQNYVKDKIYTKKKNMSDTCENLKERQYGAFYSRYVDKQIGNINRSIFTSIKPVKFYNLDIFDFLSSGVKGDTIYLDPSYSRAIRSYEDYYEAITDMITKGQYEHKPNSVFNTDGRRAIDRMILLCDNFDKIIVSFYTGKADDEQDARISSDELLEIVRRHRPRATLKEIPFRYSLSPKRSHLYTEVLIYD